MLKLTLIVILFLGFIHNTQAKELEAVTSESMAINFERDALIVLINGDEFNASGIVMDQNSLTMLKWKTSKDDNWNDSHRSLQVNEIARLEFIVRHKDHRHNSMHFWHRGWMWGGVMLLMMIAMISGGVM